MLETGLSRQRLTVLDVCSELDILLAGRDMMESVVSCCGPLLIDGCMEHVFNGLFFQQRTEIGLTSDPWLKQDKYCRAITTSGTTTPTRGVFRGTFAP